VGMSDAGVAFAVRVEPCAAPEAVLVTVVGEVDALTTPRLQRVVAQQFVASTRRLILDLAGVSFLSAAGLTVLVAAARAGVEHGVDVCLLTAARAVLRPMQVTGLDGLMPIHSSKEHALAWARELDRVAGDGDGRAQATGRFVAPARGVDTGGC
jgi:anti-sigma B factor antagonist